MSSNHSRSPGTSRQSYMKRMICNNPACNAMIKNHLWINKGVYCGPWCERNFGKDPNKKFKRKIK